MLTVESIANYIVGRKHDDKRLNVNRIYISNNCLCEEHVLVIRLVLYRGGYCHLSYELHRNTIVICQTVQS